MTNSDDIIIRARGLNKTYRLYSAPHYRMLDMLGLLRKKEGAYTEHRALADVDLEIRRGEKVALIGRNGAGKSTLLKLITRVTRPTSGDLEIQGHLFALLQVGTGFHPDFTGRQNVLASLSHQGIMGQEAEKLLERIVDFAELEEYIDQPIKTYSTGMGARLMFATSTVVAPELLVLDEILGVGDAYFAHKSFARIQEMCDGAGTTVLLVSHDIYSASKLCDRMIWIDRGRVVMDAESPVVIRAYEDSIREQEERRLRKKKVESLRSGQTTRGLVVEIKAAMNRPQPAPLYVGRIELHHRGSLLASMPLGPGITATTVGPHPIEEDGCWGESSVWRDRTARAIVNHGSPFHKAATFFPVDGEVKLQEIEIRMEVGSEAPVEFLVQAFLDDEAMDCGAIGIKPGEWTQHTARPVSAKTNEKVINATGRVGTGAIYVDDIRVLNERDEECLHLPHGRPMSVEIDYEIRQQGLQEKCQVLLALHRNGVEDVCRIITRDLTFDQKQQPRGTVRLHLPRLMLSGGQYTVTVMIAKEGYYEESGHAFYSISRGVYACLVRVMEIAVVDGGTVAAGTVFVPEGEWSIQDRSGQKESRNAA